jgi:hypothetical protein
MSTSVSPIAKAVHHLETGDWQAAHAIVQNETSSLGCWAHGIVHLVEGDLANARYWYRRAHRTLPDVDTVNAEIAALKHSLQKDVLEKRADTRSSERTALPARSKKAEARAAPSQKASLKKGTP